MRGLIVLVLLGACGEPRPSDAELHTVEDCDVSWIAQSTAYTRCERPCVMFHDITARGTPDVCTTEDGSTCSERTAFEYKGVLGCCKGTTSGEVAFRVCEGE